VLLPAVQQLACQQGSQVMCQLLQQLLVMLSQDCHTS
jgi:hypothetical protein